MAAMITATLNRVISSAYSCGLSQKDRNIFCRPIISTVSQATIAVGIPVGLAPLVRFPVIDGDLRVLFALRHCQPSPTAGAVGVVAVITHQVFVLIGDAVE